MEAKHIEPFINATTNLFKKFFSIEPTVLNPFLIKKDEEHTWEVSGVIGIAGEAKGVVAISFTSDMACRLTGILTGTPIKEIGEDVIDTIGEIVNIIAGNAKQGLEEHRLVISLPSIITGKNHVISWPGNTIPVIGIPFKTPDGLFHLSVGLENIITW